MPDEAENALHFRIGADSRNGYYATPGYDERWEEEKAAQQAERIRLLYVAATRARDYLIVPQFRAKLAGGSLLEPLEPLLTDEALANVWLVDADEIKPVVGEEEKDGRPVKSDVNAALKEREVWEDEHTELVKSANEELELTIASSMERSLRPLSAEASHSASTLIVSDGPPLPVGDALHLVMERVSLPDASDLDSVVESVCLEAEIEDRAKEVREMAERCLSSPTVKRAIESGTCQREVPFTVPWDGGFATGRIDLVYRDEDGLVVVDYKTDEVATGDAGDALAGAPRWAMLRLYEGAQ